MMAFLTYFSFEIYFQIAFFSDTKFCSLINFTYLQTTYVSQFPKPNALLHKTLQSFKNSDLSIMKDLTRKQLPLFAFQFQVCCCGHTMACITRSNHQVENSFQFRHLFSFYKFHYAQFAL